MAGEQMTSGAPIWLDEAPRQTRPPEAHGVGAGPCATIEVMNPRLGKVRINVTDYDETIHGEILARCEPGCFPMKAERR